MWLIGVDSRRTAEEQRPKGATEKQNPGALGIRKGGPAAGGPGTACEALGRPERQTGGPHGLQH